MMMQYIEQPKIKIDYSSSPISNGSFGTRNFDFSGGGGDRQVMLKSNDSVTSNSSSISVGSVETKIVLPDSRGYTPLIYAITSGAFDTVNLLLELLSSDNSWFNYSIDYRDPRHGMTPLHYAIQNLHYGVAKILVERGANVNLPDFQGRSALHFAVLLGNNPEFVQFLLVHGAQPNFPNLEGATSLHLVASMGNFPMLKLLVQYGGWVNVQDELGETPLFYCLREGHHQVAKFLVEECGANPICQNEDGETILNLSCDSGDSEETINFVKSLIGQYNAKNLNQANKTTTNPDINVNKMVVGSVNSNSCNHCLAVVGDVKGESMDCLY